MGIEKMKLRGGGENHENDLQMLILCTLQSSTKEQYTQYIDRSELEPWTEESGRNAEETW